MNKLNPISPHYLNFELHDLLLGSNGESIVVRLMKKGGHISNVANNLSTNAVTLVILLGQ